MKPDIDIGVLFRPRFYEDVDEYFVEQKRLERMFTAIYNVFPNVKFYFAPYEIKKHTYPFDNYDLDILMDVIKAYHHDQPYWFNILERAENVIKDDFDERSKRSIAKIKNFVVITENTLQESEISYLNEIKPNEVSVVNFAMAFRTAKRASSEKLRTFSLEDVNFYIELLQGKQSKLICD